MELGRRQGFLALRGFSCFLSAYSAEACSAKPLCQNERLPCSQRCTSLHHCAQARFEDCFRMFNPLTQEVYTETVESWSASFFALLSLLPRHPDIQKELALPTAAAEGGQTGPAAGGGGSGGTAGTLGRRGGDAAQPNDGAAAGQQQQQADGAGGAAVREPAGVLAASSGAGGSGGEAAGSGDGGDGSSADKALEIASALREHMQQQDGGEAQQQGQQGGSAAAASGRGGLEPLAGGRPRSGVASAIYWLTLAALGALAGRAWVLA